MRSLFIKDKQRGPCFELRINFRVICNLQEKIMNMNIRLKDRFLMFPIIFVMLVCVACESQTPTTTSSAPIEVGTVTLATERVVLTTELPGRTSAYQIAEIRPQVSGLVQKRSFEEGADVKAGDLLYQVDPAQYQAAYDQAVAALELAESKLPALEKLAERLDGLAEISAVGQQDADDATSALATAKANVALSRAAVKAAKINLDYTPVLAPISGRIGRASVNAGALVTAYQAVPLATIQQLNPIYVDVTQASADLLKLRRSAKDGKLVVDDKMKRPVRLLLEDGTSYPVEGTFQFRDATVDQGTGSVSLRIVFPNLDYVLLPGMYVRATIETGTNEQAILVPQQGVSRDTKAEPYVLVLTSDGTVEQRYIKLDRAIGNRWLVADGLKAGDRVIVEGLQKVRAGTKAHGTESKISADLSSTEQASAQ